MNEIINSLDKRLDDVQQIFDKAWEENKILTPPNSLSRLCATLTPGIAQDIQVAINALREQAERDNGCVWCKEDNKVFHDGQHFHMFCSYCGKRLEVKQG